MRATPRPLLWPEQLSRWLVGMIMTAMAADFDMIRTARPLRLDMMGAGAPAMARRVAGARGSRERGLDPGGDLC